MNILLCQKCCEEIPNNSLYCPFCLTKTDDHISPGPDTSTLFCVHCGRPTVDSNNLCINCQKVVRLNVATLSDINRYPTLSGGANIYPRKKRPHFGLVAVFVLVAVIFVLPLIANVFVALYNSSSVTANASSIEMAAVEATSSGISAVDKVKRINEACAALAVNAEKFLKEYLKYPDTSSVDYSACSLEYHRAYCLVRGTIEYTNNQGAVVEKPFQVGMYTRMPIPALFTLA